MKELYLKRTNLQMLITGAIACLMLCSAILLTLIQPVVAEGVPLAFTVSLTANQANPEVGDTVTWSYTFTSDPGTVGDYTLTGVADGVQGTALPECVATFAPPVTIVPGDNYTYTCTTIVTGDPLYYDNRLAFTGSIPNGQPFQAATVGTQLAVLVDPAPTATLADVACVPWLPEGNYAFLIMQDGTGAADLQLVDLDTLDTVVWSSYPYGNSLSTSELSGTISGWGAVETADDGTVYLVSNMAGTGNEIGIIDPNGTGVVTTWATIPSATHGFGDVTATDGYVYVSSISDGNIYIIDRATGNIVANSFDHGTEGRDDESLPLIDSANDGNNDPFATTIQAAPGRRVIAVEAYGGYLYYSVFVGGDYNTVFEASQWTSWDAGTDPSTLQLTSNEVWRILIDATTGAIDETSAELLFTATGVNNNSANNGSYDSMPVTDIAFRPSGEMLLGTHNLLYQFPDAPILLAHSSDFFTLDGPDYTSSSTYGNTNVEADEGGGGVDAYSGGSLFSGEYNMGANAWGLALTPNSFTLDNAFNGNNVPVSPVAYYDGNGSTSGSKGSTGDLEYICGGVPMRPDVSILKSVTPMIAEPGDTVLFTIVVENIGVVTTTGGVTVTDAVPSGLTVISAVPAPTSPNEWVLADMLPGESITIVVNTTVAPTVTDGTLIENIVTATTVGDIETTNNTSLASVTIQLPIIGSVGNLVKNVDTNAPIGNVIVYLQDGLGNTLETTTTDANGMYLFSNLAMGDYIVELDIITLPANKNTTGIDPINVTLTDSIPDVLTADFLISLDRTIDTDGDGLPDYWEITGDIDGDGVMDIDLPAMGADPNIPDIFVELDYMGASYYRTHKPHPDAIRWVVEAFAAAGIHLHVDYGADAPLTWGTDATWGALSDGEQLSFDWFVCVNQDENRLWEGFDNIKSANFENTTRADIFHYNVWAHHLCDDYGTTSGISRGIGASDFIVSLGGWGRYGVGSIEDQAGTFMHELGHNLGLRHGGHENDNYKTNYFSVMNYLYQAGGLSITGQPITFDYSHVTDPVLTEGTINETVGLPAPFSWAIDQGRAKCPTLYPQFIVFPLGMAADFNCNGSMSDMGIDINVDGAIGTLTTHDDWSNIVYGGGEVGLPANELGASNDTAPNPMDGAPDLSRDEAECIRSASNSAIKPVEILMTESGEIITPTLITDTSGPKSSIPWVGDSNCGWVSNDTLFRWGLDGIGGMLDGTYVQVSIGRQLIMIIINAPTTRSANRVDEFTITPGVYNLKLSLLDENGDEVGSDIIRIEVADDHIEVIGHVTKTTTGTVIVDDASGNEIGRETLLLNHIETATETIVKAIPDTVTIQTEALIGEDVSVWVIDADGSTYPTENATIDSELSEMVISLPELTTYLVPLNISLSESGVVAGNQLTFIALLALLMITTIIVYHFHISR